MGQTPLRRQARVPAATASATSRPPATIGSPGPEELEACSPAVRFTSPALGDPDGVRDAEGSAAADGAAERGAGAGADSFVGVAVVEAARFEGVAVGAAFFVDVPERVATGVRAVVGALMGVGVLTGVAVRVGRRVGEAVTDGLGVTEGPAAPGADGAVPGLARPPPSWNRQPTKPPAGTFSEPIPTLE